MEIITGTTEFFLERETAVAIGKFDGVHIGHRRLLEEIIAQKKAGLCACVFTFDPSPALFFGKGDGRELCTKEEKRLLLERIGIDILVEFPLNEVSASIPAKSFVADILINRLNASFVAAGKDLSFGAGGRGDAKMLEQMAAEYEIGVKTIDKVCVEEGEVSSTLIRTFVEQGKMELAEKCLGIPYPVMGKVQHGRQIGRTIGVPTVNLIPASGKLLPPAGVYASDAVFCGKRYSAISNIGTNPTVSDGGKIGMETHILDFKEEIYDEEIEVYLKRFLRPEKKFESLSALKEQLEADIAGAREK